MGAWHARAARRNRAKVVAVIDVDEARARTLADDAGATLSGSDLFSTVGDQLPDAVHIATPPESHVTIIERVISAGVHVLAEKPLAESADETRELLEQAKAHSVLLCPVHQLPFQAGASRAAAALDEMGPPSAISMRIFSAGGVGLSPSAYDALIGEILPHPLSLLCSFWPRAMLSANSWSVASPAVGEFAFGGEFNGALLSVLMSLGARPPRLEMSVAAPRGSIDIDFFHGYYVRAAGRASRMQKMMQPFATGAAHLATAGVNLAGRALRGEVAYPGLDRLVGLFYAAVRTSAPSPITMDEAMDVAAARDTLLRMLSHRRRAPVAAADREHHGATT